MRPGQYLWDQGMFMRPGNVNDIKHSLTLEWDQENVKRPRQYLWEQENIYETRKMFMRSGPYLWDQENVYETRKC